MFLICLDLSPAQQYLKRRVSDWCWMSADSRAASSPLGELRKLGSSTCISSILVCLSHTFFHWNSHRKSWHPNFHDQIFVFKTKYWSLGVLESYFHVFLISCLQSKWIEGSFPLRRRILMILNDRFEFWASCDGAIGGNAAYQSKPCFN